MLGLQNEREWEVFCARVLQRPELATEQRFSSNARRSAAREEINAIIVEVLSRLTAEQVVERLENAQIANARMNDMHDVWSHPQLRARGRWFEIDTPAGKVPALAPPGMPAGFPPRMDAVPALGEHTEALLTELGYEPAAIARLRDQGAI